MASTLALSENQYVQNEGWLLKRGSGYDAEKELTGQANRNLIKQVITREGRSEKRRYCVLVTTKATAGTAPESTPAEASLLYFSKKPTITTVAASRRTPAAATTTASIKGSVQLTDTCKVSVTDASVIKIVVPGRTYVMRPDNDLSPLQQRTTAAQWQSALDAAVRVLWKYQVMVVGTRSFKNTPKQHPLAGERKIKISMGGYSMRGLMGSDDEEEIPDSLDGVLASEKYRNLFRDFCEFSFALENLQFYEAVEEFEDLVKTHISRSNRHSSNVRLSSKEKAKLEEADVIELRTAANSLMQDYVEEGGDLEVNLSSAQRTEIVEAVKAAVAAAAADAILTLSNNNQHMSSINRLSIGTNPGSSVGGRSRSNTATSNRHTKTSISGSKSITGLGIRNSLARVGGVRGRSASVQRKSTTRKQRGGAQSSQLVGPKVINPKSIVSPTVFEVGKMEIFQLMERNFFRRFYREEQRKTGCFAALYTAHGLDGYHSVLSHFGPVQTDLDRVIRSYESTMVTQVDEQISVLQESLRRANGVAVPQFSTSNDAMLQLYGSSAFRLTVLSEYKAELEEQVIKPLHDLSNSVRGALEITVRDNLPAVSQIENARNELGKTFATLRELLQLANSKQQQSGTLARKNSKGDLAPVTPMMERAAQFFNRATGASSAITDIERMKNLGVTPETISSEVKKMYVQAKSNEEAISALERKHSTRMRTSLDKLEALELRRLEEQQEILKHALMAQKSVTEHIRREVDRNLAAAENIDVDADLRAFASSLTGVAVAATVVQP